MFENLTEKFQRVYKNLRGEGKLTEEHINLAMGEIRTALLEADVNVKVAQQFIDRLRAKALGAEVMTSLSPAQQVVKIVRDEMVELLGGQAVKLRFKSQPPSVILMAGLQGSGKTTTSAKLAYWLSRNGHRPQLVSVDVYRPAAREQLKIMAQTAGMPVFEGPPGEDSPYELARLARREAIMSGRDTVIVDTAGRLHIDEQLMDEMTKLREQLQPTEILFVADAMIGQDAVNSAAEFHNKLGLTGIILTKMDGDARGGAAISIRQVTGQPLKFIGMGEKFKPSKFSIPTAWPDASWAWATYSRWWKRPNRPWISARPASWRSGCLQLISRWAISASNSARSARWDRWSRCWECYRRWVPCKV